MKRHIQQAIISILLFPIILTALTDPTLLIDKSTKELAASLAIKELSKAIAFPGEDWIYTELITNSQNHIDPVESEKRVEILFRDKTAELYKCDTAKILNRLADENDISEIFSPTFLDGVTNAPSGKITGIIQTQYNPLYRKARKLACQDQAKQIAAKVHPTENEVDTISQKDLSELLTKKIVEAQTIPVFKENHSFISDSIVKPIMEDAYNQRNLQRTWVRTLPASGYAPSSIASNLTLKLNLEIEQKRKNTPLNSVTYAIFPSVQNEVIPQVSNSRAIDIIDKIERDTPISLNLNNLAASITASPHLHKRLADSETIFSKGLEEAIVTNTIRKLQEIAPVPEHPELLSLASSHLTIAYKITERKKRIKAELETALVALRDAYAKLQFKKYFPLLDNKAYLPEDDLVDKMVEKNPSHPLNEWRQEDLLSVFSSVEVENIVLEETSRLLDNALTETFQPGIKSRETQHKIITELYPSVLEWFKKGARKSPLPEIILEYTSLVTTRWKAERKEQLLPSLSETNHYLELFQSSKKKIELLSKTIMESPEPPKPEPQPKEEQKPEEPTPPIPPQELIEKEMAVRVTFNREHEEIKVNLIVDGETLGSYTCPYAPNSYKRRAGEFTTKPAQALGDLLKIATKSNRLSVKILLDVRDPFVYYSAVSDISWLIKGTIESFGEYITKYELTENRSK